MGPDAAIRVQGLGKRYRLGERLPYKSFREGLAQLPRRLARAGAGAGGSPEDFWALRHLDLEVARGKAVAVIGANGAGKSTLLKLLSRITEPTEGRAELRGRVGALLEVGTGFHPELTGRENVYLNGAILGMRRAEIQSRFDEIVAFSEIERFIDTPVKRYSSGMRVRLAFSVAAHLEPEVLIIDEVLAVGDAAFQRKCLGKMGEVTGSGRTVLFVSHNMSAVNNLCEEGLVLEKGRLAFQGSAAEAVGHYMESVAADAGSAGNPVRRAPDPSQPAQLEEVSLHDEGGSLATTVDVSARVQLRIRLLVAKSHPDYYVRVILMDSVGNWIFFTADEDAGRSAIAGAPPGSYGYRLELPRRLLKPGRYHLLVSVNERGRGRLDEAVLAFDVEDLTSERGMRHRYRKYAVVAPDIEWKLEP